MINEYRKFIPKTLTKPEIQFIKFLLNHIGTVCWEHPSNITKKLIHRLLSHGYIEKRFLDGYRYYRITEHGLKELKKLEK